MSCVIVACEEDGGCSEISTQILIDDSGDGEQQINSSHCDK